MIVSTNLKYYMQEVLWKTVIWIKILFSSSCSVLINFSFSHFLSLKTLTKEFYTYRKSHSFGLPAFYKLIFSS